MMIETLFLEYGNLYGDTGNVRYLKRCLPEATFIETPIYGTPAFVKEDVQMIYMGPMTESAQEKAIARLMPYKDRIQELINKGTVFLLTGNAMEVFFETIENEDGSHIEGLGILPMTAKRNMMQRYADVYRGTYENIDMVGFKTQFTMAYPTRKVQAFMETKKGVGLNPQEMGEGIHINNLYGTYVLGPILILNPLFTKYILKLLGIENPTLPFEEVAMEAYRRRIQDFETQV